MCRLLHTVIVAALALGAGCSTDYNPFHHTGNAGVSILWERSGLRQGDTLSVFSTESLYVAPLVSALLDSFAVSVPANRFFRDTVIVPHAGEVYPFALSFVDTGVVELILSVARRGEAPVRERYHFVAHLPLGHPDTSAQTGAVVELSTPGVRDDVQYVWIFGDGIASVQDTVVTPYPRLSRRFIHVGTLPVFLRVQTDANTRSPAASFTIELSDNSAPAIECLSPGCIDRTLRTSESQVLFEVSVNDEGGVSRVWIDNEVFEPRGTRIYSVMLRGLDTPGSDVRTVNVGAVDRSGNDTTVSFFVVYDLHAPVVTATRILVSNVIDTAITSNTDFLVLGQVYGYGYDSLLVTSAVNGAPGPTTSLAVLDGTPSDFALLVRLDSVWNRVQLFAREPGGGVLADTVVTVLREEQYIDNRPPMIIEVRVDGEVVPGRGQVYTEADSARIAVRAFDESGIAGLMVDGVNLAESGSAGAGWWSGTLRSLARDHPRSVRIVAVDSAGLRSSFSFLVQLNRRPVISSGFDWPTRLFVGEETRFLITVLDDDETVTATFTGEPQGMNLSALDNAGRMWEVTYTPNSDGIGQHRIVLTLDDGYHGTSYVWEMSVVSDAGMLVAFQTTAADIAPWLQAGVDTLTVALRVVPMTGTPPLRFVAQLDRGRGALLDLTTMERTSALRWAPTEGDTGLFILTLSVEDREGDRDVVRRTVQIVPRNRCLARLVFEHTADTTAFGEIDLRGQTAPVPLHFRIEDCDHHLTESYTIGVTHGGVHSVTRYDSAAPFAVTIDPCAGCFHDTLTLTLADSTGSRDTLRVAVRFNAGRPLPDAGWEWPRRVVAGSAARIRIPFENYPLPVELLLQGLPSAAVLHPVTGTQAWELVWTPQVQDVGLHSASVRLSDPYGDTVYLWELGVLADSTHLFGLDTSPSRFPRYVEQGRDLWPHVAIAAQSGQYPLRVWFCEPGGGCVVDTLLYQEAAVRLAAAGEIGTVLSWQVAAQDALGERDSMLYRVEIVPPNQHPCSLMVVSYGGFLKNGQGELDLTQAVGGVPLTFRIVDQDHYSTERFTVTVSYGETHTSMIRESAGNFQITLKPHHNLARDTLRVAVTDRTGHTSTIVLPLLLVGPPVHPCSLSVHPGEGVTDAGGWYAVSEGVDSARFSFVINDADPIIVERYEVRVLRNGVTTLMVLDTTRTFDVHIGNSGRGTPDTVVVTVVDLSGYRDTLRLVVRFASEWVTRSIGVNLTSGPGGAGIAGTVAGFALPVRLHEGNFDFSPFGGSAPQLQIRRGVRELSWKFEEWDRSGRRATLWILADTLSGGAFTTFVLEASTLQSAPAPQPGAVFNTSGGFAGVWHLSCTGGGGCGDATGTGGTMLPMGGLELSSSTIQGVIGQGVDFNGTSEWLEIPPPATALTFARDYSISAWVRLSHTPSQSYTSVVGRRFSTGYEDSYDLGIYNTKAYFAYAPGYMPMVSNVTVSPGTWVHMTGVKQGPKATLYVNGVEAVSLEGVPEVIVMDDNHVTIGGQYNYSEVTQHFPGSIDEVRVESVARSAEWILLAYETQKPGATAVVVQ